MKLCFLTIYYSLGSPCCLYSENNISTCTEPFCDKNISRIFILHLALFADQTQTKQEWLTILVCKKLYGKYIYIAYISHACFGVPKKTLAASHEQTQLFETRATFSCI